MANRKYDPIRETFQTDDLVAIPTLQTAATPPADLAITPTYIAAARSRPAWPRARASSGVISAGRLCGFQINDVPRLLGMGLFCNLGDCIVDISNHNNGCEGAYVNLELNLYDSGDNFITTVRSDIFRFNTLQAIFDYDVSYVRDLAFTFSLIPYSKTANQYLRFDVNFGDQGDFTQALYSTILMDPAFKTKRFSMWANLVIEHSYEIFHPIAPPEACPDIS